MQTRLVITGARVHTGGTCPAVIGRPEHHQRPRFGKGKHVIEMRSELKDEAEPRQLR